MYICIDYHKADTKKYILQFLFTRIVHRKEYSDWSNIVYTFIQQTINNFFYVSGLVFLTQAEISPHKLYEKLLPKNCITYKRELNLCHLIQLWTNTLTPSAT